MNYIAFDAHKRYTLASVERSEGGIPREGRVGHEQVSEIELAAGCVLSEVRFEGIL